MADYLDFLGRLKRHLASSDLEPTTKAYYIPVLSSRLEISGREVSFKTTKNVQIIPRKGRRSIFLGFRNPTPSTSPLEGVW